MRFENIMLNEEESAQRTHIIWFMKICRFPHFGHVPILDMEIYSASLHGNYFSAILGIPHHRGVEEPHLVSLIYLGGMFLGWIWRENGGKKSKEFTQVKTVVTCPSIFLE